MKPLEFFLGLKEIKDYKNKVNEIKRNAVKTPNSNDGIIQWASICAELGVIYIIAKKIDYEILGFEQKSPKSKSNKTCDIEAIKDGYNQYFEVKRKCSQTAQKLPLNLQKFLIDFKCNFGLVGKLHNRKYQCNNFKELQENLIKHIKNWECGYLKAFPNNLPPSYSDKNLTISFYKEDVSGSCFFQPDMIGSIKEYIFGNNKINKNGKPMISMVTQVEQKGADYLCCRIPDWDSYDLMIESFFEKYKKITATEYETTDKKMKKLKGIILFCKYDKYCIINNSIFNSN